MKPKATYLLAMAFFVTAACGGSSNTVDARDNWDDAPNIDAAGDYHAEVVESTTFTRDDRAFPVELVRIYRPDGTRTYVQWIGSDLSGLRPTVLATDPYGGIDWSGEAVDLRWAGRAEGTYPDVDGPNYDGATNVTYMPHSVESMNDQSYIHLLNGLNVLQVHGRFYAGGDLADEVADMQAGMWYLTQRSTVERSRVATFGGSWGGFEALYASAYGDRLVAPKVTVAMYPPVDLGLWLDHASSRTEPAASALNGHRQRILHTSGGTLGQGGNFAGFTASDLCAGLPEQTLVLHDELDALVPISQSENLIATCGGDAVYWRRTTEPAANGATHGPLLTDGSGEGQFIDAASTYGLAYMYLELLPSTDNAISVAARSAMLSHFQTVYDAQTRGDDVAFAAPRMRQLCDPRLSLLLFTGAGSSIVSGAQLVAELVNEVWGTSYTGATIAAALATGLPPL